MWSLVKYIIIISNSLAGWPFSSAGFQGALHNISYKINIQYLRSRKVNLERSLEHWSKIRLSNILKTPLVAKMDISDKTKYCIKKRRIEV